MQLASLEERVGIMLASDSANVFLSYTLQCISPNCLIIGWHLS